MPPDRFGRDDIEHALDALASDVPAPTADATSAIARGRDRARQRRIALVGVVALLVVVAATAGVIAHANGKTKVSTPPQTAAPGASVTEPAPAIASVSSSETWICSDPLQYTADDGARWRNIDVGIQRQSAANVQAPLCAAIPGGSAWVLSATPTPGWSSVTRIRDGGAAVDTFRFPPLLGGEAVAALTFADSEHGWALTDAPSTSVVALDLYATVNGGRTWSMVARKPPIVAKTFHFSPAQVMNFTSPTDGWAISSTWSGLEHTTDGGRTWRPVKLPLGPAGHHGPFLDGVFAAGNTVVVRGGQQGETLYQPFFDVSTDGGNTWSRRLGPGKDFELGATAASQFVAVDATHWRLLPSNGELLVTDDAGRTWVKRAALSGMNRGAIEPEWMEFSTPDDGWISGTTYPAGASFVRHTTDAGRTWVDVALAPPTPPTPATSFVPVQTEPVPIPLAVVSPTEAWLCASPLRYTADAGTTWTNVDIQLLSEVPTPYQQTLCAAVPGGEAWVLTGSGDLRQPRVVQIQHGGRTKQTFAFAHLPDGARVIEMTFVDADNGWAVVDRSSHGEPDVYRTHDGGATWSVLVHGTAPLSRQLEFENTDQGWASGYVLPKLASTTDGGRTWRAVDVPTPNGATLFAGVVPALVKGDIVVAYGAWSTGERPLPFVDVSTDRGRTWSLRAGPNGVTVPGGVSTTIFNAADADHWALGSGNRVYVTADGGRTWTQVAEFAGFQRISSVAFLTPDVGLVSGSGDPPDDLATVVLQTTDGGRSWTNVASNIPSDPDPSVAAIPGGIIGCPTQPLTVALPDNSIAQAAQNSVQFPNAIADGVYRMNSTVGEFASVFNFNVGSCGQEVMKNTWVAYVHGVPNAGEGGSTARVALALAHYADGWHVFGRYP